MTTHRKPETLSSNVGFWNREGRIQVQVHLLLLICFVYRYNVCGGPRRTNERVCVRDGASMVQMTRMRMIFKGTVANKKIEKEIK